MTFRGFILRLAQPGPVYLDRRQHREILRLGALLRSHPDCHLPSNAT